MLLTSTNRSLSIFWKSQLNAHIQNEHENVRYDFDKCEKCFSQKEDLKQQTQSDKCDRFNMTWTMIPELSNRANQIYIHSET